MSSGDGDNLNMVETVQLFLRDILDQVVNDAVETEAEIGRDLVHQILDNVILEVVQIVEGNERRGTSVNGENEDKILDKLNTRKDAITTQQDVDQEKCPMTSVTATDYIVDEDITRSSDIESRQSLNTILHRAEVVRTDVTEVKPRCRSSMLEFAPYSTTDKILDKLNTRKDAVTTQDVDQEKCPMAPVTATDHIVDEDITRSSDIESRQSLNVILHRAEVERAAVIEVKPRCRSSMLEFALFSTTEDEQINRETPRQASREYDSTSGNNLNRLWIDTNISEASSFADRLDISTNKYGQLQAQRIKSLQSEYVESIVIEKTDAKVRVKADELKGKVFPKFSKQKKKKTRYGKVKIYYNETLSKDEQNRVVKEAEELLKHVIEEEKENKKQRKAAEKEKSLGARIRKFFGNLFCCKSSGDD